MELQHVIKSISCDLLFDVIFIQLDVYFLSPYQGLVIGDTKLLG